MSIFASSTDLQRVRKGHDRHRVTFVELFFDLVFVFAITQLSHALLKHATVGYAAQLLVLLMAIWWVWIYTSWVTNWLDPDQPAVRIMLYVAMLAGLVMSASLPSAYDSRGLIFAVCYVAIQLGRSLFMMWALSAHNRDNYANFERIASWFALSGIFWLAGGFADGGARVGLWVFALLIDYVGPFTGFWTPHRGRSDPSQWDVEGGHLAERCGLFIIIALGESILVAGATFAKMPAWSALTVLAFSVAFVGSVAMWWIYFNIGAEAGEHKIRHSDDPGRIARAAYTYAHLLIIAGVVVSAAGDELVLAHPYGHTDMKTAAMAIGGPALFIIGNIAFKRLTANRYPLSHLVGLGCLALVAPTALIAWPIVVAALVAASLVLVAAWETISLAPKRGARAAQET